MSEAFEPEKVFRFDVHVDHHGKDEVTECVDGADYDKLLALYLEAKKDRDKWEQMHWDDT